MIGSTNVGRREAAWLLTFFSIISFSSGQIQVDWGFDYPELMNATVGDTVQFVWPTAGYHDIWIHPFGTCKNTTGAIAVYPQPTTGGNASYTFLPSDGSPDGKDVFFACHVGNGLHCQYNVNQPFKVYSRNDTAAPSISSPTTSPTLLPTTTATTKTPTTKPSVAPSPKPTTVQPTMTPTLAPGATVLPTEAPIAETSTPPPSTSGTALTPTGAPEATTPPTALATLVPSVSPTNITTSRPTEMALNSTTSSPSDPAFAATVAPSISPVAVTLAPSVGSPVESTSAPSAGSPVVDTLAPSTGSPVVGTLAPSVGSPVVGTLAPSVGSNVEPVTPSVSLEPTVSPSPSGAPATGSTSSPILIATPTAPPAVSIATPLPTTSVRSDTVPDLEIILYGVTGLSEAQIREWERVTSAYLTSFYADGDNRVLDMIVQVLVQSSSRKLQSADNYVTLVYTQTMSYRLSDPDVTPAEIVTEPFATPERRDQYVTTYLTEGEELASADIQSVSSVAGPSLESPAPAPVNPGENPAEGNQDDGGDGLSTGAIIGITFGVLVACLFCCLYNIYDQRKRGDNDEEQETLGVKEEENPYVPPSAPATFLGGDLIDDSEA